MHFGHAFILHFHSLKNHIQVEAQVSKDMDLLQGMWLFTSMGMELEIQPVVQDWGTGKWDS
jgi:hypothetical protein